MLPKTAVFSPSARCVYTRPDGGCGAPCCPRTLVKNPSQRRAATVCARRIFPACLALETRVAPSKILASGGYFAGVCSPSAAQSARKKCLRSEAGRRVCGLLQARILRVPFSPAASHTRGVSHPQMDQRVRRVSAGVAGPSAAPPRGRKTHGGVRVRGSTTDRVYAAGAGCALHLPPPARRPAGSRKAQTRSS